MQWCCLSRRTTLCTGPPRTLWMLGSAWEADRLRRAVITHLTTSRCEGGSKRGSGARTITWTWVVRGHGLPEKNERVGVCLPVFVCEREGRAEGPFGSTSQDCQRRALLIACWCEGRDLKKKKKKERKKINSVETALFGPQGSPQHHRDPR